MKELIQNDRKATTASWRIHNSQTLQTFILYWELVNPCCWWDAPAEEEAERNSVNWSSKLRLQFKWIHEKFDNCRFEKRRLVWWALISAAILRWSGKYSYDCDLSFIVTKVQAAVMIFLKIFGGKDIYILHQKQDSRQFWRQNVVRTEKVVFLQSFINVLSKKIFIALHKCFVFFRAANSVALAKYHHMYILSGSEWASWSVPAGIKTPSLLGTNLMLNKRHVARKRWH